MKTHTTLVLLLASISIAFAGCGSSNSGDPVVGVEDSNAEMNAAMEKARGTFDQFLANWKTMPNDAASVKFGVPTRDDSVEHIWFEPSSITDTEITGICGNDPVNVDGLKLGDVRTFPRSELSDWMILDGGKCYGGYTIRVLVEMEPENAPPLTFVDF